MYRYYVFCSAGLIKVILMVSCYTQWSRVITRIHYEAIIIIYWRFQQINLMSLYLDITLMCEYDLSIKFYVKCQSVLLCSTTINTVIL